MTSPVERARAAFARRAWREACEAYAAAAEETALDVDDHQRRAVAAYLAGDDAQCDRSYEAAQRAALDAGDAATAARCAFWLGLHLMLRGQMAQAGGWLARTERLVADAGECAAAGYLLVPALLGALGSGDAATARDLAARAQELGARFDDADLEALGLLGHAQALIALGETAAGTAQLDEVMVMVATGALGPVAAGIVYCAVIIECLQLFDVARAAEWTDALSVWCDAQPDLVAYRGQCLVHRSQVQQATGSWDDAVATAASACERLADPPHPALGMAHYQDAELHRLRGDVDRAEAEYQLASRHGHHPMPGLALLELARGDVDAAAASITVALGAAGNPMERPSLLAAAVEIRRAANDVAGARAAADELAAFAAASPVLAAMAAHANGTALLAEGDAAGAVDELRRAARTWQSLRMPYDGARTATTLALACAALGDRTTAALELDNARATFTALGATPDLDRLAALAGLVDERGPSGDTTLSAREREVLVHLAAGKTNREIAAALVISAHTVGRHVENIFVKLGVTSRAAATSAAYEQGLLERR